MSFAELIKTGGPILLDGAMGSELEKSGLNLGSSGLYNILHPELVSRIHIQYVNAGSQVLTANTFALNPIYVKNHRPDLDFEKGNRLGVQLARKAAGEECYVLGNLTSCGQLRQPLGPCSEKDFYLNFKEQAKILAEEGVDGFLIETMFDLKEALCGLKACLDVASLPVIVSFAFNDTPGGFRTIMGDTADQCALEVARAGGSGIGANCGELELNRFPELVRRLRESASIPVLVQPNAGLPKISGTKAVYDLPADSFAQIIKECVTSGAVLVGGCCGTGPEHIKMTHQVLSQSGKVINCQ
ncbi:MAG: homocysteine S-methyltransferase family protein [Clostridia bacterium]|nr:homocysteine S-methyltransferase family protein [Clostridia bacterium]